ncbi:DUF5682 family protein [Antribacter sp. KLBMP9083]|uniref:DUF5682 family protein n=1 Tax=Antribacter soli TaxID=2910976 RepID=A0AA41QH02_9MICO|nr:DUF5682 family protein [Antribacter soli]MCF4122481.1 DUF5682 family protein [Antribacter soli]
MTDVTVTSTAPARAAWGAAPERLQRAADAVVRLREEGIVLAPVRHHSPACAVAVRAAIEELRPAAVLIEGPEEYTRLIPDLLDEATRPPIAVLSLGADGLGAGFYPLASFSPEWVALRAGRAAGAELAFVDRPWGERTGEGDAGGRDEGVQGGGEADGGGDPSAVGQGDPFARTLMSERYLAHSRSVADVAQRLGCRDHDEVWDHLFEARPTADLADWRTVFDDVLAWAALARLDYEDTVLAADGSLDREARMSARVTEHAERLAGAGPVLVVTGAFHTLALVEALAGAPEGAPVRDRRPAGGYGPVEVGDPAWPDAWLIRYDHQRLDGLRGYGAGMPSPGWYQRLFAAHESALAAGVLGTTAGDGVTPDNAMSHRAAPAEALAREVLVDVARGAAGRGHAVSLPQVSAAAEQAVRLADLRERPHPARSDVLDAITSCYLQDDGGLGGPGEGDRPLGLAVAEVFGGRALGDVPAGSAQPPLVRDARERVVRAGLTVDDSVPRKARLDARRTPSHRARRQVLALLELLGADFGRRLSGPDHVAGRGLGLLLEEWEYAWTPLVEARLVELSHLGATLDAAAVARLREEEERLASEQQRSADGVARLLAQALVVGLGEHLPRLVALLRSTLDVDRDLASIVAGGQRLLHLWRARAELDAQDHGDDLLGLVDQALATAAYLVADLGRAAPEDEDAAVGTAVALRALVRAAERAADEAASSAPGLDGAEPDPRGAGMPDPRGAGVGPGVQRELARLREDPATAPAVRGGLLALGYVDGEVPDDVLLTQVRGALLAGADPGAAVRFLGGILRAAPDLLLHTPELFDAVDGALRALSGEAFLAVLPDLRRAFTWLRPTETHRLAERAAARAGVRADMVNARVALDESDLAAGLAVERELAAVLGRDGLAHWSGGEA